MSHIGNSQMLKHMWFKKYLYFIIGVILFSSGLTTILVIENISKNLCSFDTGGYASSGSTILVCNVTDKYFGRDLTFEASFFNFHSGNSAKFPSNVKIIDPNGVVLISKNFDDKITLTVKTTVVGNYKALVTYLSSDDKIYDRANTESSIQYGIVTGDNPLGLELAYMELMAALLHTAGIISLGYGGIKLVRNRRNKTK